MEGKDEQITVNVFIGDMRLPMKVANTEQEKVARDAAAIINKRLQTIRTRYSNVSSDYHYAMALLNAQMEAINAANKTSTGPIINIIDDLTSEIDDVIKK